MKAEGSLKIASIRVFFFSTNK